MARELYIWVAFFIIVIAVASYFRFFYQTPISLSVQIPSFASSRFYPYQSVTIPMKLTNTGSSPISNMSFGLYINGNVSTAYGVTLPAGKETVVDFNFTPKSSGNYSISLVADPQKLYDIVNRNAAQNRTEIVVVPEEKAAPYMYFNSTGLVGEDNFNMSILGYWVSRPLYYNSSVYLLSLTGSRPVDSFFYAMFGVFSDYINGISVSHAFYNNYNVSDVWINGYLTQNAISDTAIGLGLNVTAYSNGVDEINFGNRTTLCSFYSGGWIQNLVSINGSNCMQYLGNRYNFNYTGLYNLLQAKNYSVLNFTGYDGRVGYAGAIVPAINNSFIFDALISGSNASNLCYGNILNISNESLCSTSFLIGSNSLISENERLVGNYSINVWAIANQNYFINATDEAVGMAAKYNLSGQKIAFRSAFSGGGSTCVINQYVNCTNATLADGNLSMTLRNDFNTSINVTGISCSSYGIAPNSTVNISLAPHQSEAVIAKCYNNGALITGIPVYLRVYLTLYYKSAGKENLFNGYAYVG